MPAVIKYMQSFLCKVNGERTRSIEKTGIATIELNVGYWNSWAYERCIQYNRNSELLKSIQPKHNYTTWIGDLKSLNQALPSMLSISVFVFRGLFFIVFPFCRLCVFTFSLVVSLTVCHFQSHINTRNPLHLIDMSFNSVQYSYSSYSLHLLLYSN